MTKTELREKIKGRTPYSEPELELFILPLLEQERGETAERCARVYWEESTYKKVPAYDGIKAAILACGNPPSTVPEGYPFGKDAKGKQCDHLAFSIKDEWFYLDRRAPLRYLDCRAQHCDQCGAPRREQP